MTIEDRTLGDVFISRCEDKNTLQNKGDLYVGTGATIAGLSGSVYDTQTLNAPTENGQILTKDDLENGKGVKYQNIIEAINNTPNVKIENVKNTDKTLSVNFEINDTVDSNVVYFTIGEDKKVYKKTVIPTAESCNWAEYANKIEGNPDLGSGRPDIVEASANLLKPSNDKVDLGVSDNKFRDAYFSGEVTSGTFNATSDKRLKENIKPFECEKSILDLPVYTFNFKSDKEKNIHVGCLAQDLKEICPEIVHEDSNGYLSIEETKLVYLLIQEVGKLQKEIEKLEE